MQDRRRMKDLEDRVVATLSSQGLIRQDSRWWRDAAIAAAAAIFGAGAVIALQSAPDLSGSRSPAETYMLALYETPSYRQAAGDGRSRAGEYARWAAANSGGGARVESGEELGPEPLVLGPPPAGDARLAGYFLVRAESREEAVSLARTTPHLRYGGTVVVHETIG